MFRLVFVLAISVLFSFPAISEAKKKVSLKCSGDLGVIDVQIVKKGRKYQKGSDVVIKPVDLNASGDIVSIYAVNKETGAYRQLIEQTTLIDEVNFTAGILSESEIENYDTLIVASYDPEERDKIILDRDRRNLGSNICDMPDMKRKGKKAFQKRLRNAKKKHKTHSNAKRISFKD